MEYQEKNKEKKNGGADPDAYQKSKISVFIFYFFLIYKIHLFM